MNDLRSYTCLMTYGVHYQWRCPIWRAIRQRTFPRSSGSCLSVSVDDKMDCRSIRTIWQPWRHLPGRPGIRRRQLGWRRTSRPAVGQRLVSIAVCLVTDQISPQDRHGYQVAVHGVGDIGQMPLVAAPQNRSDRHRVTAPSRQTHPRPPSADLPHPPLPNATRLLTPAPGQTRQPSTFPASSTASTQTRSSAPHPQTRPTPAPPWGRCNRRVRCRHRHQHPLTTQQAR